MEVAVSKEEMLPPDSATWRGILQLERYSPVSRSPFQAVTARPTPASFFILPPIPPRFAAGVLLVAVFAAAGWLLWGVVSFPAQKTIRSLPGPQVISPHLSSSPGLHDKKFTVPPPPLPDAAIIVQSKVTEMESAVVTKNISRPEKQPAPLTPKQPVHPSAAVKYPGVLDAVWARVNEGAEENNKPSIQVRKVNPRELAPATIKEEVIHE